MILKKKIQDGKTVYEPISFEDAISNRQDKDDFLFTDEDEKDNFENVVEQIEELKEESDDESDEKDDERESDDESDEKDDVRENDDESDENDDERSISWDNVKSALKKAGRIAKKGVQAVDVSLGNLFSVVNCGKSKNSGKLMQIIPFLDDDDVHEIMEDILSDPDKYDGLNLCAIMPFLSESDCNALFMRIALDTNKKYEYSLSSLAPFVSEKCLSKLVDKYVAGELEDVNMDQLYPFLSSKDVKRLFKHIVSQNKKD